MRSSGLMDSIQSSKLAAAGTTGSEAAVPGLEAAKGLARLAEEATGTEEVLAAEARVGAEPQAAGEAVARGWAAAAMEMGAVALAAVAWAAEEMATEAVAMELEAEGLVVGAVKEKAAVVTEWGAWEMAEEVEAAVAEGAGETTMAQLEVEEGGARVAGMATPKEVVGIGQLHK